jgi:hypothetical protein
MLGTGGERTDVWAHGFGVAAGLLVGAGLGRGLAGPPRPAWQVLAGALALAIVLGCWWLAGRAAP